MQHCHQFVGATTTKQVFQNLLMMMPSGNRIKKGKLMMYVRPTGMLMNKSMRAVPGLSWQGFRTILNMADAPFLTSSQALLMTSPNERSRLRSSYKISRLLFFLKIIHNTHLYRRKDPVSCISFQVNPHRFLHSNWLVPPNHKGDRIQTGQCERNKL